MTTYVDYYSTFMPIILLLIGIGIGLFFSAKMKTNCAMCEYYSIHIRVAEKYLKKTGLFYKYLTECIEERNKKVGRHKAA